ncbi:synaptosomal-associated protein 29 [Coccinella septempunctata]|uniref:synaptosomal-associated protein 29 n=1 Tax=Coccinella septempunctata TaxID=41139 RepID=UPI001D08B96F|nr:synaptosomal-associated protein 29 [Coccinella septempunctata]
MSGYSYKKSTNPFEIEDVDDETFLKNTRKNSAFDNQVQAYQERRKQIEERTINSTERSISVLRDSEQIGIATAEELMRQREKLEKTDKQLDEINATLRFSQKHINGIRSVFSSLKNYVSGRNDSSPSISSTSSNMKPSSSNNSLKEEVQKYDRYENHPSTRLKQTQYENGRQQSSGKDFEAKLDANLQEMCMNISRLKGLATDLSFELDSQNDLISTIVDKTETADMTIAKQNKDMMRILRK